MQATEPKCSCCIPTLYYDELCPQSRSCYMLIKVLDIEVGLQPINLMNGEHLNDSFRKINPSGTIPTLIDGQFILSEGHTIMMFLCDKYAGVYLPHLCPRDYLPRLKLLNILFYEGCVLHRRYSHLLLTQTYVLPYKNQLFIEMKSRKLRNRFIHEHDLKYKVIHMESGGDETEILSKKFPNMDMSYHQGKVIDCYKYLDSNLKGQSCMTGNCLTIADLSVITTLSGLDLMFPISQDQWPNLHRWFENLKTMVCYKYNNEGLQKLSHLLETEGQFPLPFRQTLEATSAMRSSLQLSVDIDKEEMNSLKVKETTELPWIERRSIREQKEAKDNDRKFHSPIDTDKMSSTKLNENTELLPWNERTSLSEEEEADGSDQNSHSSIDTDKLSSTKLNMNTKQQWNKESSLSEEEEATESDQTSHSSIDTDTLSSTNLNENTELQWNDRHFLREEEEADHISHSASKEEITSAPSEDDTEIKLPKYLPRIRTSKVIISPSHTDNEEESSPELEKLYEKPVAKELRDSEMESGYEKPVAKELRDSDMESGYEKPVAKKLRDSEMESGVEDCVLERNTHYKASDCLCCRRSSILNKSNMDWICRDCVQKNQRVQDSLRMTGPNQTQIKDTFVITCSSKNPVSPCNMNKVKCVEFECKVKNTDETQYYPDNEYECPCCSNCRHNEICANVCACAFDEGELREFRSCICIENCDNCDPLCECAQRKTERQREGTEMNDPHIDEREYSYKEIHDVGKQECEIDCNYQVATNDEDCESFEDGDEDAKSNWVDNANNRENNFVCCCVEEDDNNNTYQEVYCCCDEDKEEEDFCCSDKNPLYVDQLADDLICCCDDEEPYYNGTSNDLECCCERDNSIPTSCDDTSHITICLCDGSQATPLSICYNDNRPTIEENSNDSISCCCNDTDTSIDDNCSCVNEYQDSDSVDGCDANTDDSHMEDSAGSNRKKPQMGNSHTSNATLICCIYENYQRVVKDENGLNCCSCLECSKFTDINRKGHSEDQSGPRSFSKMDGFRDEAVQNRVGKCCCRPDINCHQHMERINKTSSIQDDSNKICNCGTQFELQPHLRDNKATGRPWTCATSVTPTSPHRYICICGGFKPLPNREGVIQIKTTQCEDGKGTPKNCCCSAGVVDTKNWNISQPGMEEKGGLYKHETLDQERRTFGSFKATQQKPLVKLVHNTDDAKVNAKAKTLSDPSKEMSSPAKPSDKLESMGYEGNNKKFDHRMKANTANVSGKRKGPLEEVQNNNRSTRADTGKRERSSNQATISERKSATPPGTSVVLQKKYISNDPKPDKEIKTSQDLSGISDDIKGTRKYGPTAKMENADKTEKGSRESMVVAKNKEDGKKYEALLKNSDNKKTKVGDKTNDENRNTSTMVKSREPGNTDARVSKKYDNKKAKVGHKTNEESINATKGEKASALAPESGNTEPRTNGKEPKSGNKIKEDITGTADKDRVKLAPSKVADQQKVEQASNKSLASSVEIEGHGRDNNESKSDIRTKQGVETNSADKQLGNQAALTTANQQETESQAANHSKSGTENKEPGSSNKQRVKQSTSKSANEQRASQASRSIAAETNNKVPDKASKQKVKQPAAKYTNQRRTSQASAGKRGSKVNTDKGKVGEHDNRVQTDGISKRSGTLGGPLNLVRIKCTTCPSTCSAVCVTVPNTREQKNCLKCQTHCTCILTEESAPTMSCPVLECKLQQCCEPCPHQSSQFHCNEQIPCGNDAEQRCKVKYADPNPCEIFRAQQTNYQSQPASCSKVKPVCSKSFQVTNCERDLPSVGLHSMQQDKHILCKESAAKPTNCCPSGNKVSQNRVTCLKKIACTPRKTVRKSKRLTAGSSQPKPELRDKDSKPVIKRNVASFREKNGLQSQPLQDIQDSTSNISQEEVTSIRHFYNWNDFKGEQPKALESKRRDMKNSKIPRLILPKVYLVYRESHDLKPSQKCNQFSKLPMHKLYGGQDHRKGNQEIPLRYTYQEPKCSPEIIKKCCRTNPSRIPQLDRDGLSTRRRSETTRKAEAASGSIACPICEKYLQSKSASRQRAEWGADKSLSEEALKELQPKPSRSRNKNQETICITKVKCCRSNGCLIKKVSRVTTTSIRRESPSYAQNLGNSLSSLSSACNSPFEAVNIPREEEENEPRSIEGENKQHKGLIRECKCCHCRGEQTENLRERAEREQRRNVGADRTGNVFNISQKQGRYQNEPNVEEQRQSQQQTHQINNKRSNIGTSLRQAERGRDNDPQDTKVYKPREFSCYPSSHRDGSKNTPTPGFILEQDKFCPHRIRGGLTDQLGKQIKSDTYVRVYDCSCKKSDVKKISLKKRTNRDLPKYDEYCSCNLEVTNDNSPTQIEPRPSAYSESRLSNLINGPRRTITNPGTFDVSRYNKSAIPQKLVTNPDGPDTFLRIYGCSCKKLDEMKTADKCKGKRIKLAANKVRSNENDSCKCDSIFDKNIDKSSFSQNLQSCRPKKHNPNPVILNVSIKSGNEENDLLTCICCREKKRSFCENMVDVSCTCCCGEQERRKMYENGASEKRDEQIIRVGINEGLTSQYEDSRETNMDNTARNGQSLKEDFGNMKLGQREVRSMPTEQDVPAADSTEYNKETTTKDGESTVQTGNASQEDLPELNKDNTVNNDQSPKEDSRNMKLRQKDSKSMPTKQVLPVIPKTKTNKETSNTTKHGASIDQRVDANQDEDLPISNKGNSAHNSQSPKGDSRYMKFKESKVIPTKQDVWVADTPKTGKKTLNPTKTRETHIQTGDASQEDDSPGSNMDKTARNSQSLREGSRHMKLSQKENKSMTTKKDVSADETSKSKTKMPKTTNDRESAVQRGDLMERSGITKKSVSDKLPDDANDLLLGKLTKDSSNVDVFPETREDISQMQRQKQNENREYNTSPKEMTFRVFRCVCGRTIPCPYRQQMCSLECLASAVEKCCQYEKEDNQSKVKETIEPQDKNSDVSSPTLESTNEPIKKDDAKQTVSRTKEATKSFISNKDNSKIMDKITKKPTKTKGKELTEDFNGVGRKSEDPNGNGRKEYLPGAIANRKAMTTNGNFNSLHNSTTRNSNATKTKAKTDITTKSNRTNSGRTSKDETVKYKFNLTATQSQSQESSKIFTEPSTKESIPINLNEMPENIPQKPTKEDQQNTAHSKSNHNSQDLPENLCDMSNESFMKGFGPDDTNIPGSCDAMVVTKRTHFLKRNGAEKIEEKCLITTKPSTTDLGNCSQVGTPEADTEVIKKYKRVGDKVCTITITKGSKVK